VTPSVDHPVASRKSRSRVLRGVYLILGFICLGFVAISFIPGIPTFDFVILAAFFFSMSSEKLHQWLLNHPVYGKMIKGYRAGGLTVRMKWFAAVAITVSLTFSIVVLIANPVLRVILGAVGVFALWFVFSRPTRAEPARSSPAADGL